MRGIYSIVYSTPTTLKYTSNFSSSILENKRFLRRFYSEFILNFLRGVRYG